MPGEQGIGVRTPKKVGVGVQDWQRKQIGPIQALARIVRQPFKNGGSKNNVAVGSGVPGADETVFHPWTGQSLVGTRTRWNKRK